MTLLYINERGKDLELFIVFTILKEISKVIHCY